MIATREEARRRREPTAPGNWLGGWLGGFLGLAVAPTFAAMALLTFASGGDADVVCSAMHGASPLGGMVPMYVLMSVFHARPWVKLISRR
jgi:hypothetical protein